MVFPLDFTYPEAKAETAQYAATSIAGLVDRHGVVVQAGGCSGLWPMALAAHFDRVYTFEPDPTNFACLRENTAGLPSITAVACALGDTKTRVGLTRPKAQAGLWRVEGDGDIPMVPLDAVLGDVPVDALVLDVEGSEVRVLRGAARLIGAHRPLIWLECLSNAEAIAVWLEAHGYTPPQHGVGGDYYSIHTSRVQ